VRFEWHHNKAARNEAKHGVAFAEVATVFLDPLAVIFDNEWHSAHEQREIIIGQSDVGRLLIVYFVERERDDYEEYILS